VIVCVRLPYFAASAARRTYQIALGAPVAIVRHNKIVATCAYAAEAGVAIGLTVRQAQTLLPELHLVDDDADSQRQMLEHVLNALAEFTPLIEYGDEQGWRSARRGRPKHKRLPDPQQSAVIYIDLEHLRSADAELLVGQMGVLLGIELGSVPRVGMANGKFPALAASWASLGEAVTIPSGDEADCLAGLPITLLPIDPETYRRLTMLGLRTLGQVAALPLDALLIQFGGQGYLLRLLAQGHDQRRVVPHRFGLVEQVTREFDEPLTYRSVVEALLRSVAFELAERLRAKTCMGRTLTLRLRLENDVWRERRVTLRQPIADALHLERALIALLDRVGRLNGGVLHIVVSMENLTPLVGQQLDLFTYSAEQRARLLKTVDALSARYDANRFWWISPANPSAQRIELRYRLHGVHEA